jgi:hypothetical protein
MKKYLFLALLSLCFLATPALAASPTRIGSTATGNFTPSTQDTVAFTTVSGNNIVLQAHITTGGNNSDPTSVLWGGCAGTAMTKVANNNSTWGVSTWILVAPAIQSSTVCANFGSSIRHNIFVVEYQDMVQATPLDISGSNSSASATSNSKTVVTTVDNDICISLLAVDYGQGGITDNSGQTSIATITDVVGISLDSALSEKAQATAGSISMGYTWPNTAGTDLLVTCFKYVAPAAVASGEDDVFISQ